LNLAHAIETDDEDDAMRERRCIVRGEVLAESRLIRFAVSPDGEIVPDIGAVLPGRGIWVSADGASLAIALKKGLFSRAAKASVKAAPDLASRVEALLVARMQADLGMARRSGQIVMGFDAVRGAIQADPVPGLVIEASDGAADGKRKVFAAAHARGLKIETLECLSSAEISLAVGRENVIHAALKSGRLQERLSFDGQRLSGFRRVPEASSEKDAHESEE
jgi:predicted RNA-binding protein YlxR (DUF448 family)